MQFAQKDHISAHKAAPHDGKKPFNCAFCNAMFSRKQYMKDHIIYKKTWNETPHKCENTGFSNSI